METSDPGSMTIVCFSGDLDRVWPQYILATTGAAYGMDVMLFCTFWGLYPLKRPEVRITGEDWMTRMLGVMNNERLSHLNVGGAGPKMMRRIARRKGVAPPDELMGIARELGVRIAPCQMTMDLMGLERSDLIDGLEEPLGAAAAVAEMKNADIQLFI
ncbi:MAG: DsrE/DsrF/DrsH-like family protein [Nitriliruptoraceae bacterium]